MRVQAFIRSARVRVRRRGLAARAPGGRAWRDRARLSGAIRRRSYASAMGTTRDRRVSPARVSARCVRRRSAGAVVRCSRPAACNAATARLTATLSMAVRAVTSARTARCRRQHRHDAPLGNRQAEVHEVGRRDRRAAGIGQYRQPVGQEFLQMQFRSSRPLVTIETKSISSWRPVMADHSPPIRWAPTASSSSNTPRPIRSCCAALFERIGFPRGRPASQQERHPAFAGRHQFRHQCRAGLLRPAISRRRTGPRCAPWHSASGMRPRLSSAPSSSAPSRIARRSVRWSSTSPRSSASAVRSSTSSIAMATTRSMTSISSRWPRSRSSRPA